MTDFARIKANVELMASKGAPAEHINDYLHSEGLTSHQFKARVEGMKQGEAVENNLNTALRYSAGSGVANLIDLPGRTVTAAGNLFRMGAGALGHELFGMEPLEPIRPDLLDVANPLARKVGIVDDAYAPTTVGGKLIDFGTQAITGGGINPRAVVSNLKRGMVQPVARDVAAAGLSGTGAGVGHVLTENVNTGNESLDAFLKAAGTFAGGMGPGAIAAARGTAGDRVAAAMKDLTPAQLEQAKDVAARAAANGTPITGYEAIQFVTGLNPKMQTQQRVTEQSDAAARGLTQMMQNRSKNNSIMFNKNVDTIAPAEAFPDTLAGQLKTAAEDAISGARRSGNAKAEPLYKATSNDPKSMVNGPAFEWAASDPLVSKALEAVKKDPIWGVTDAQPGSLQWMDAAKKWLDDKNQTAKQQGANNEARMYSSAIDKLVQVADASFPQYGEARAVVADNMRNVVKPMEASQVGKLARSDDFKQQSETLLPNAPADVTPSVIQRTAQTVGAKDPEILKRFVAQDQRRKFNEANQQGVTGEPAGGGAKYAATVAGNAEQEANLLAAIAASGAPTGPFKDTLDIFRAQGYKPSVNSATASNLNETSLMGGRKLVDLLMRPIKSIPGQVDNWRNGWATSGMADALASGGDSVARLEELARINGVHDPMKQQILINLILGDQAATPSN